ncbi:Polysaccharide pyruvyl transferase [Noviherbaspirillum humi]|uniref:Polysaccharide pyruvyl transferase n=1 Tax=Noviherbaspirillum humi TaxID=1688639 RepID=A0A239K0M9_9BURK|nr:polysaccharide pyruvyl transferase family protein [Noviherbaspirillum humi]SNT11866.1 Polysaccharide pyruvyl transferase [Noviherbaspirillum humi]
MAVYKLLSQSPAQLTQLSLDQKLTAVGFNSGNLLFEEAVRAQIEGEEISRAQIRDIDPASTLVMCLANYISPSDRAADAIAGLCKEIESRKLEKLVLVGVGAQQDGFEFGFPDIPKEIQYFTRLVSERTTSIGVRGYFTADLLSSWGIKNVKVIGCPSVYQPMPDGPFDEAGDNAPSRIAIGCTLTGHFRDSLSRLLGLAVASDAAYIAQTERFPFLEMHAFESHYYSLQCKHDVLDQWFKRRAKIFFDVNEWVEYYRQHVDFYVSSRFHGVVAALYAGVPSLPMVFDSRTRELVEFFGMPYIFLKDVDQFADFGQLYRLADFSAFFAALPHKRASYHQFLKENGLTLHGAMSEAARPGQVTDDCGAMSVRLKTLASYVDLVEAGVWSSAMLRDKVATLFNHDRSRAQRAEHNV